MIAYQLVLAYLSLLFCEGRSKYLNWSYSNPFTNPLKWSALGYKAALGSFQSPININTSDLFIVKYLKPVRFLYTPPPPPPPKTAPKPMIYIVENTGSCVDVKFVEKTWYISFLGDDIKQYEVVKLRFHWGSMKSHGSEHTIDGKGYAAEVQLIAYNSYLYKSYEEAARKHNGLAILVILLEQSRNVPFLETVVGRSFGVTAGLYEVLKPFTEYKGLKPFNLSRVMELVDTSQYYRYWGSMTEPPCTQNVMWTIFMQPNKIHILQIHILRSIQFPKSEMLNNMLDNYRPQTSLKPRPGSLPREVYATSRAYPMCTGLYYLMVFLLIITQLPLNPESCALSPKTTNSS